MLVTKIETVAIIFRVKALALSLQELVSSTHPSFTTDSAWSVKNERIMKKMEMIESFGFEVAIDDDGSLANIS